MHKIKRSRFKEHAGTKKSKNGSILVSVSQLRKLKKWSKMSIFRKTAPFWPFLQKMGHFFRFLRTLQKCLKHIFKLIWGTE